MTSRNDADLVSEVWDGLIANNDPPRLFAYGDAICVVNSGRIRVLNTDLMGLCVARVIELERVTKTGTSPVPVPPSLERKLLVEPDPRLPSLVRVSRVPVLAADGSLREVRGYDPKTSVWYEPDQVLPSAVPEYPTREQVDASRDFVLRELLGDFPFETEGDRTHAFGLFLLPFARGVMEGAPSPMHLVSKPDVGAGATTLVQACLAPSFDKIAAPVQTGGTSEELEKVLLAKARDGAEVVFLDNVVSLRRQSGVLAQAITAQSIEGRILGVSQTAQFPLTPVWAATGNNPRLTDEIARRVVGIRLAVTSERPWEREGWRHPDLVGWARNGQAVGQLRWAALVLLRGWIADGGAGWTGTPSGFEAWDRVVGGACAWAGLGGWLSRREGSWDDDIDDSDQWGMIVAVARDTFGTERTWTADDLWAAALGSGRAAEMSGGWRGDLPSRSLGMALHHGRGKVVAGWTIVAVSGSRPRHWVVRDVRRVG